MNRHNSMGVLDMRAEIIVFLVTLPGWVVVAKLYGLYDHDEERTDHSTADDFAGVFHMVTVCTWLFWVGAYVTGLAHPTTPKLLIFWAAAIVFITLGRATARSLARRNVMYLQNTVIVGAGDVGQLDRQEAACNIRSTASTSSASSTTSPRSVARISSDLALLGGTESARGDRSPLRRRARR